jgi:ribose-phosphate pyrophosphokinase
MKNKTRSLNLDSMFVPVPAPEIEFDTFTFSGGEVHIRINPRIDYSKVKKVIVTTRIRNSEDFMRLALVVEALAGVGVYNTELIMPYIPYARQDRRCSPGDAKSLQVFAYLLNEMSFRKVWVLDPHSKVAETLINNIRELDVLPYIEQSLETLPEDTVLVAPDKGAAERVGDIGRALDRDVIYAEKVRDPETGKLLSFSAIIPAVFKDRHFLIVDDICDGGGTFLGLADELYQSGAKGISLYVTHGIFSKGITCLQSSFKHIFCTNSFSTMDLTESGFTQLNLRI